MSNNKKSHKETQRRSALSFANANGSLDIDHVLQSKPWKNIKQFQKGEAGRIQSVLNDFDTMITKEKINAAPTAAQKNSKSTKSTKKVTPASEMKNLTKNLPKTSNEQNNVFIPKTTIKEKEKSPIKQASTMRKTTTPREFQRGVDDVKKTVQKSSQPNKNIISGSIAKKTTKIGLQDVANITEMNLQTSTPKQKPIMTTNKSAVKKKTLGMKNSETNSKGDVKCKDKHKKKSKKNEEGSTALSQEKKRNVDAKKLKNNVKCNEKNNEQNASKSKAGDTKAHGIEVNEKASNKLKKSNTKIKELKNATDESIKTKSYNERSTCDIKEYECKCSSSFNGSIKKSLKKEDTTNKLHNSTKSSKLSQSDKENMRSLCKECVSSFNKSELRRLRAEKLARDKEHTKSKKAARAIHGLSRDIDVVKKKMQSIRNDLESSESSDSGSSCSTESSRSLYSSSSYSYTSDFSDSSYSYTIYPCFCSKKHRNYSEYTLNSSCAISNGNSGEEADESDSQSEKASKK